MWPMGYEGLVPTSTSSIMQGRWRGITSHFPSYMDGEGRRDGSIKCPIHGFPLLRQSHKNGSPKHSLGVLGGIFARIACYF